MINKNTLLSILILLVLQIFITACGLEDDSVYGSSQTEVPKSISNVLLSSDITNFDGNFMDTNGVEGLKYTCGEKESQTGIDGAFTCDSLPIEFYMGDLYLGRVNNIHNDYIIFTTDLVNQPRGALSHPLVLKTSILIQTLDQDANLSNGTFISPTTISTAKDYFTSSSNLEILTNDEILVFLSDIRVDLAQKTPAITLADLSFENAQDNLILRIATILE